MNTSILSMNQTVGERELKEKAADLTPEQLRDIATECKLEFWVKLSRKYKGVKQQAESFYNILKITNTDPAHRLNTEQDYTEAIRTSAGGLGTRCIISGGEVLEIDDEISYGLSFRETEF